MARASPDAHAKPWSLAMVVDKPTNTQRRAGNRERQEEAVEASASSLRAGKRARQQEEASASPSGACAGVIVPHAAVAPPVILDVKPINAVAPRPPSVVLDVKPINVVPPRQPPPAARQLPSCLREHFLSALGLHPDLAAHFITQKLVTSTNVDAHQNRFLIPVDGVERLRAILTPTKLDAANLLHDMALRPRHKPKKPADDAAAEAGTEQGKKMKEPKKKGKAHGGLRVKLVDIAAGAKGLQMSRWNSSRATVVKGEGYLDFIRWCSFGKDDAVEIWAFIQRPVRIFGVDLPHGNSVLHMLIVKKHEPPHRCCYCPIPVPDAQ